METLTRAEQRKKRLIEIFNELLQEHEAEVQQAISAGAYEDEGKERLEFIAEAKTVIKEFEEYAPDNGIVTAIFNAIGEARKEADTVADIEPAFDRLREKIDQIYQDAKK